MLSAMMRVTSDLDVAEECAQEAYVSALQAPGEGLAYGPRLARLYKLLRWIPAHRSQSTQISRASISTKCTSGCQRTHSGRWVEVDRLSNKLQKDH